MPACTKNCKETKTNPTINKSEEVMISAVHAVKPALVFGSKMQILDEDGKTYINDIRSLHGDVDSNAMLSKAIQDMVQELGKLSGPIFKSSERSCTGVARLASIHSRRARLLNSFHSYAYKFKLAQVLQILSESGCDSDSE
ncbi:hypothetical protein CVT24_002433 [Panaeolus cyanescens]|uniref:Uncharacterized protein n=1 Tax=Panaeolus cyanescens TaxID=181874 RepID=A0A409WK09_9AGAR|nr:hypothetical protein CVT24_002433 [Panaeolus cyanescens]